VLRLLSRAGPDRSAIPNLPELSPWLGAALFGTLATLVVSWAAATIGLPFWPLAVVVSVTFLGAMSQPAAQRLMAGGSLDRRAGARVTSAMTCFAVIAYGCGLPSLMPVFALVVASVHLHWSGWRIWRLVAVQSLAFTFAGEVAIGLGLLPSVLSQEHEHAVAALFLFAGTQALSNLGLTSRRREEIELELRRTESRFRALVQKSHDVVAIVDREGRLTYLSPAAARLTSHPVGDLRGRRLEELLDPRTMEALKAAMIRTGGEETGATEDLELKIGADDEQARWLEVVVTNQLDDAAVSGFVLNATDVTDRRRYREQLVHAATHDPLTGLMNRSAFVTTLQRELADVSPSNQAWLLFCDLDGFKSVNDGFGHDAGDAVLVHAARQLRRRAGPRAVVGRFGGDEFCVLIPAGRRDHRDPHELRELLAEAVAQPCLVPGGQTVRVRASFGLVSLDGRQLLADEVLHEADQRMYERKRRSASPLR
jgi:diguanylate cyclase (GGDEF)-like protein/PAS domain S-box-containing protein